MAQQNFSSRGRQSNEKKRTSTTKNERSGNNSKPKKTYSSGKPEAKKRNFSIDRRSSETPSRDPKRKFREDDTTSRPVKRVIKTRDDSPEKIVRKKVSLTRDDSQGKVVRKKASITREPRAVFKNDKISKNQKPTSKTVDSTIRLNKYIANAGICSRREADMYIKAGNVTVNGKVVTEMGYKVLPHDEVKFDNTAINPETKRYVLLNKPKDYITTVEDDRGRKTVMDLVVNAAKERIYPVGRLDRNTTGLLLFTNDGELAKKLTHPKHNIHKLYHVTLDKNLIAAHLKAIADPKFMVEDLPVYVDHISYVEGSPKSEVGVEIHSGRNRIVRKIFESLGYSVVKLDRVVFAGLTKKDLPKGRWRHLTDQEIINLRNLK